MLIRCPECHFERDIDITLIPPTATVATCPKCGSRFRFRDGPQVPDDAVRTTPPQTDTTRDSASAPTGPAPSLGDDPLPPGAVIPNLKENEESAPAGHSGVREANEAPSASQEERETNPRAQEQSAPVPDRNRLSNGAPWEQPDRYSPSAGLYATILGVLFRAPDFFAHIRTDKPLTRPAVFFVLISLLDALMSYVWQTTSLNMLARSGANADAMAVVDGLMQGAGTNALLMLVMTPFLALIRLFFLAGLYHLMIRLAQPDRADFATVARVVAYSAAPLVLSVVPMAGGLIGSLWFVACTFVGCKYALGLGWGRVTLALAPLFILEAAALIFMARMVAAMMSAG